MTKEEQLKALIDPPVKAKYVLHYATDVTKPPGAAPSDVIHVRSIFHLIWVAAFHKGARAAVLANRFQVWKIDKRNRKNKK